MHNTHKQRIKVKSQLLSFSIHCISVTNFPITLIQPVSLLQITAQSMSLFVLRSHLLSTVKETAYVKQSCNMTSMMHRLRTHVTCSSLVKSKLSTFCLKASSISPCLAISVARMRAIIAWKHKSKVKVNLTSAYT